MKRPWVLLAIMATTAFGQSGPTRDTYAASLAGCLGSSPRWYIITDGASTSDCLVGGGAFQVRCWCDSTQLIYLTNLTTATPPAAADTTCNDASVACLFAGSSSEGGVANSALALSANPTNCAAGQYPLGIAASGAAESCTTDADTTCLDGSVSCLFAASASEGGAATTADALSADPPDCFVGFVMQGMDAMGSPVCVALPIASGQPDHIIDADGDTSVHTETTPGANSVVIKTSGVDRAAVDATEFRFDVTGRFRNGAGTGQSFDSTSDLVIDSASDDGTLHFLNPLTRLSRIYFGNPSRKYDGGIYYHHTSRYIAMVANGVKAYFDSRGLRVTPTATDFSSSALTQLYVQGDVDIGLNRSYRTWGYFLGGFNQVKDRMVFGSLSKLTEIQGGANSNIYPTIFDGGRIGIGAQLTPTAFIDVVLPTNHTGLRIRGFSGGQVVDLTEWQDDTGVEVASIDRQGAATFSQFLKLNPRSAPPATCDAAAQGTLYTDSDTAELCFCDGTTWTGLKAGGACA